MFCRPRRLAGYVAAEMARKQPRILVIAATGRIADHEFQGLATKKLRPAPPLAAASRTKDAANAIGKIGLPLFMSRRW